MTLRATLVFVLLTAVGAFAADRPDPLLRARLLYNSGDYDLALAAAEEGRALPGKADVADLIAARAYLEKFRATAGVDNLDEARTRLRRIKSAQLNPAERLEYLIGLGEALYFDGSAGAASEVFDSILADPSLGESDRERVLDWWAGALDEQTRGATGSDRYVVSRRVRERMRAELGRNAASTTASYWVAAAARAEGDLLGAWDAVRAGWVRAALAPPDRGRVLRDDLERLMIEAIAPGRARELGRPLDTLLSDWEQFKERWIPNPQP